jgi:transposase
MGRKRTYKTTDIKHVSVDQLVTLVDGGCIVAIDVAKQAFVFGIATLAGEVVKHIRFEHPTQTRQFLSVLDALRGAGSPPTVLFEPTGTYGDTIIVAAHEAGHPVFLVQPRHTHDAREFVDNTPSTHDAKACSTMVYLHRNGCSRRWHPAEDSRRSMKALLSRYWMHAREIEQRHGMLEAMLQRHWPEFSAWLEPRKHRSGWALLQAYPSPRDVARDPAGAEALLRRASRNGLADLLIAGLVESTKTTLGVPMLEAERQLMRELVGEIERHKRANDEITRQLRDAIRDDEDAKSLEPIAGVQLAAAITAMLGSPNRYNSSASFLKAAGMNLRVHQSGTMEGGPHLTKRGPALLRQLLYLAALRLIKNDPIASAWYERRAAFKRDEKTAAVVALARKLLKGIWAASRSAKPFDTRLLFDTRRLTIDENKQRDRRLPEKRSTARPIAKRTRRERISAGGAP